MNKEPEVKYTEWPVINIRHLASGMVSVPIKVKDWEKSYDCHFLAGMFAFADEGPDRRLKARFDWALGTVVEP